MRGPAFQWAGCPLGRAGAAGLAAVWLSWALVRMARDAR